MALRSLTALTLLALAGCIPVRTGHHKPHARALIKVPARVGLAVEVPAQALFATDRSWEAARDAIDGLSVTFKGEPVRCMVRGGDDGRLDPEDAIVFQITEYTRHAPFLAYEVVMHDRLTGEPGARTVSPCQPVHRGWRLPGSAVFGGTWTARVTPPQASEPITPTAAWRDADYLVLAPREWLPTLDDWSEHRTRQGHRLLKLAVEDVYARYSGGNPDPAALQQAVRDLHRFTDGGLRFLMLVGDVEAAYEPDADAPATVPTFYEAKVHYPGYTSDDEYPTDHPYGVLSEAPRPYAARPPADIAVGRIPARSQEEAARFLDKLIGYERAADAGDWRRRLLLFGGPANYGTFIDSIIENQATWLLNEVLPYDWDLQFVFAKKDSPYAWRLDRLGSKLADDLGRGALFAAYFGHGLAHAFDYVGFRGKMYAIGERQDLEAVRIAQGKPVFFSFTCHTGAFDRKGGEPSLAEVLAMNPHGPVGVFASSRASHPYNNALYAQSFIDVFLRNERPTTLGEGLLALKREATSRRIVLAETLVTNDVSELKREHEGLYNLLGDPATRLAYPDALPVATAPASEQDAAPGGVRAGGRITVRFTPDKLGSGSALITLETERATIRHPLVSPEELARMPLSKAVKAMMNNHRHALDKVVHRHEVPFGADVQEVELAVPEQDGRYVVKVFARGEAGVATGHSLFHVRPLRTAHIPLPLVATP